MHRANESLLESADGSMATVANSGGEKPLSQKKNPTWLDRPSHGRPLHAI